MPTTLPQRTLLRHLNLSVASGQAIARSMRAPVVSACDLDELASRSGPGEFQMVDLLTFAGVDPASRAQ